MVIHPMLWESDLPPDLPLIGSTLESRHCTRDAGCEELSNGRLCLEEQPAVGK